MPEAIVNVRDASEAASGDAISDFIASQAASQPKTTEGVAEPPKKEPPAPAASEEQKPVEEEQHEEETEVQLPEGYVAVPAVTEGLITEFTVRDTEGEIEIPNLTIEYKANGKVRKDRLDQVVKMAQQAAGSVARERQFETRAQEHATREAEARELLATRERQLEELLADPDLYAAASERYAQANSPEQREARLKAQLKQKDEQMLRQQTAVQAQVFMDSQVFPALEIIAENLPEVGLDELQYRLGMALVPMMKDGIVPPARYGEIRKYITTTLVEWAQDTHNSRSERLKSVKKTADETVEKAQAEVQETKNRVARVIKPASRGTKVTPSKAGPKNGIVSLHDATEDAVAEALKGVTLTG